MKEYFEKRKSPETGKEENVLVIEYSFEDWEQGIGDLQAGKIPIYNSKGMLRYDYFPISEHRKMVEAQRKLYWEKVDQQCKSHKGNFNNSLERSGDKIQLLQLEIEKTRNSLMGNPLYEKVVIRGNRSYHLTKSPNCKTSIGVGDFHHIKVESLAKYYEWLKNFPVNSLTEKESLTPELNTKLEIFHQLIGLSGNHNSYNTTQPVYHYIKDVLKKYSISPIEAKEIVNDLKGSVSPDWNKNVIPFIIDYLKEVQIFPRQNESDKPRNQNPINQAIIEPNEIKPILIPDIRSTVFDLLKNYFKQEHQAQLKYILETGNNANEKLLFQGNGNKLADTFKKIFEHKLIIGCQKQDLENWILKNFKFVNKNIPTDFKPNVLNKYISGNNSICKSPLIEIKNGKIQKTENPLTKNYNKY